MSVPITIAKKRFSSEDQLEFARLSGDRNPMHMDALAARRTQSGSTVVHGIHSLLWALENVIATVGPTVPPVNRISGQFQKLVNVGDTANLVLTRQNASQIRAQIQVDGLVVTAITLALGVRPWASESASVPTLKFEAAEPRMPLDQSLDQIAGQSALIRFAAPAAEMQSAFPLAARQIGASRIAALAAASRLVGMICPGLHSILSAVALDLVDEDHAPSDSIQCAVLSTDNRFRLVTHFVQGGGLKGEVVSFVRTPPVEQASIAEIAKSVDPAEFKGSVALVAGASRGLGQLTARILAAGGAHVIATYAAGRPEAEQLATEIREWGGACDVVEYDVRKPSKDQLHALRTFPTHLYYFATAPIFRQKPPVFSPQLFHEFLAFYVTGFHDLCQTLRELCPAGARVFYPSSIALDDRPPGMTEYAMAKAAGEILCADMSQLLPGIRVLSKRLPRMLTDQTATVIPARSTPALEVMLPIVREVQVIGSPVS